MKKGKQVYYSGRNKGRMKETRERKGTKTRDRQEGRNRKRNKIGKTKDLLNRKLNIKPSVKTARGCLKPVNRART
jgi:fatty acid-binding protein DegV